MAVADRAALRRLFRQVDAVQEIPEAGRRWCRPRAVPASRGRRSQSWRMSLMPSCARRRSIFAPMPAMSRSGMSNRRCGSWSAVITTSPSGFIMSDASLASRRLGAMPTELVEAFPDMGTDTGLDPVRERHRRLCTVLIVEQAAGDLVDRADPGDGNVFPDLLDDRVVELDIFFVPGGRDDQVAAQALRLPHRRAG